MKTLLAGLLLISSSAFAAADSVAVFFSANKTVVLLNEHQSNRIHTWMDSLGVTSELHIVNADESFKMDCGRTAKTASCTIRLLPSNEVQFGNKVVTAEIALPAAANATAYGMQFESSRGDTFNLLSTNGILSLKATKR